MRLYFDAGVENHNCLSAETSEMVKRENKEEAKFLFNRIRNGEIEAYTSALTFDELAYRLILALIRDHHKGSPLDRLRNDEQDMIRQFYPIIAPQLSGLRHFPHLTVLEVSVDRSHAMIVPTLRRGNAAGDAPASRVE